MISPEDRITELEKRVAYLESIVQGSERERFNPSAEPEMQTAKFIQNETAGRRPIEWAQGWQGPPREQWQRGQQGPPSPQRQPRQTVNQESGRKDKEALVGKYIIGALAAVLIFVAAISFIGLVWNWMTPEIKLLIISLAGIILTVLGFWRRRTRKNPITSIILGTGAGLLFIDILSANLVFHLIGNNMSILLAGLWAVFFILSSRYTELFFTTIIAYIGSYITLILGLVLMNSDAELLMLIVFVSGISAVMIFTALKKKKAELLTGIILSFASYITILSRCYLDGLFGGELLLKGYAAQIAVILILSLLMNLFYKEINNTDATPVIPVYLVVSAATTIGTILFIGYLNHNYLNLKVIICYLLFFAINMIQFILNNVLYKKIEKWLTGYYAVILVFTSLLINIKLYDVPTGIVLIGLLLVVSERIFKRENNSLLTGLIILLDSLFLIGSNSNHLICSVYGIVQLGLMGYVLWKCTGLKKYGQINLLKIIGIIVILANSFGIPSNLINGMNISNISRYIDNAIGYFIVVTVTIALLKTGYFKNWKTEQFNFFGRNDALEDDKGMQVLFYFLTTGLYFYGLQQVVYADKAFLQLIFTLAVIAVALVQSRIILSGNGRNKAFTGIWIVLKYLMLTWTILWAFLDLGIISVAYSIVGLMVAIGSISVGFKLRNRSIRLYGLVLTIIMVAKFIIVDLNQENSITRVLALIAGGGLCFLISYIYNKLSENYS